MIWRTAEGERSATEIERWMLARMISELFSLHGVFDDEGFGEFISNSVGATSRFSSLSSKEQFVAVLQAVLMVMDPMDIRSASARAIYAEALFICFKGWILSVWQEIEQSQDPSNETNIAPFNSCRRFTLAFFFCQKFNSLIDIAVNITCERRGINPGSSLEVGEIREYIRREFERGEIYFYCDLLPTHFEEDKEKWQDFVEELIIDDPFFIDQDWLLPIYTEVDLHSANSLKNQCQKVTMTSSEENPPFYFDVVAVREELKNIKKNFDKDLFYQEWIAPYLAPPPIALSILSRLGQRQLVDTEF